MQSLFVRALKAHMVLLLSSVMFFTTGCEDDDHDDHDHDEEHTDADGFILEDENGTEIYREFEGAMEGSIVLSVGDTLELSVHFLDHEGNEIEHDEEEEEEEDHEDGLSISGSDETIAIVEAEDHEEEGDDDDHDHDEEHGNAIHVIGVSSGSTSFQLELMHEGHADYTSTNNVPVTVN